MKHLKDKVQESLIKSYNTDKLIEKISKRYNNIDIIKNQSKSKEVYFSIQFYNKDDYKKFLTDIYIQRQFDFFGYYVTVENEKKLFVSIEPNFGTKCTDFVYNNCNGLIFHVTTVENATSIIDFSKGLKPVEGHKEKTRYYTERAFFICGETKEEIVDNIKYVKKQKGYTDDDYAIIMCDLKDPKYNIDFYYDPASDNWHNCIYCNAWFPYNYLSWIEDVKDITVNIKEDLTYPKKRPWQMTRGSNSRFAKFYPHIYESIKRNRELKQQLKQ